MHQDSAYNPSGQHEISRHTGKLRKLTGNSRNFDKMNSSFSNPRRMPNNPYHTNKLAHIGRVMKRSYRNNYSLYGRDSLTGEEDNKGFMMMSGEQSPPPPVSLQSHTNLAAHNQPVFASYNKLNSLPPRVSSTTTKEFDQRDAFFNLTAPPISSGRQPFQGHNTDDGVWNNYSVHDQRVVSSLPRGHVSTIMSPGNYNLETGKPNMYRHLSQAVPSKQDHADQFSLSMRPTQSNLNFTNNFNPNSKTPGLNPFYNNNSGDGMPPVPQNTGVPNQHYYVQHANASNRQHFNMPTAGNLQNVSGIGADMFKPVRKAGGSRASCVSSRTGIKGSVISFHDISYIVEQKKYPWSKPVKKHVLNNVSGIMRPGMNALMGPTGSGKSSLLDVLAGRKNPKFLSGEVLIDGSAQPHNFKCISGYVVQDDIVMGTLTVRENLNFSAALRLSSKKWNAEDRKKKVEDVIVELGLTKVANSKIGTELIRGVSGGERKRTNIGMELITDPAVLFLDEPTTGLDAFTAGSVIKTLRSLALRGRTIIFSLHQPKYSIYKLFDTLTLVLNGQIGYSGPADRAPLEYFKSLGYVCEPHNSPPDFFMDILHGEVKACNPDGAPFDNDDSVSQSEFDYVYQEPQTQTIADKLLENWKSSSMNKRLQAEVIHIYQSTVSTRASSGDITTVRKRAIIQYPTSYYNQLQWVCWRTAVNLFRNPQASTVQIAVYLFFALAVGTVYVNLNLSTESGMQDRDGLFFFLVLQMTFVNLSAIDAFIKERVGFIHENSSGFYRVSAYFIAKVVCDMIPLKALPVIIFMPIIYFMAALKLDAGAFFYYELNLVMTTVAACGVAFFVSASFSIFGIANIIISIIYVFMMVFGGFLKNIKSMGGWLSWLKYFSIFGYSTNALSVNEYTGLIFMSNNSTVTPGTCPVANTTGLQHLTDLGIPNGTAWDLWYNQLGLAIISIVAYTLCYIQLVRINKYK